MCCQPPPPDRSSGGPALTGTMGRIVVVVTIILLLALVAAATWARSGAQAPAGAAAPPATAAPASQTSEAKALAPPTGPTPGSRPAEATATVALAPTPPPTPSSPPIPTGTFYPLAVMVENLADARPLSGLTRADIVYEALVEGGITRFMSVYINGESDTIGPVRSSRPYFVYLAAEFNASYVHIGWSPQALGALQATGITDLDEIRGDPGFWRVNTRPAPHNAYTSTALLRSTLDRVRRITPGSTAGFHFRTDPSPIQGPEAAKISIQYAPDYRVDYLYSPEDRLYRRSMDGLPHEDAETGEQVAARDLVIQYVNAWVIDSVGRLNMTQVGKGKALYFRDGVVAEGSWRKASLGDVTEWYDAKGRPVPMSPGKIWVEIVPPGTPVEY